jgi:hypothetical protein
MPLREHMSNSTWVDLLQVNLELMTLSMLLTWEPADQENLYISETKGVPVVKFGITEFPLRNLSLPDSRKRL